MQEVQYMLNLYRQNDKNITVRFSPRKCWRDIKNTDKYTWAYIIPAKRSAN